MVDYALRTELSVRPPFGGERTRAFAAAARHSALVRFLRVAILGGALIAVALLSAIAIFDPFHKLTGGVSVSGVAIDGTKVMMDHPKLAGFRKDGRPYLVTAERAIQDILHPTLVELRAVNADVGIGGDGASHVTADIGLYDSSKEHMDISQNVRVKSSQYDARLESASIDFKSGLYVSKQPVTVVTNNGTTIKADSAMAVDNGKQLVFDGRVRSTMPPASRPDAPQTPPEARP